MIDINNKFSLLKNKERNLSVHGLADVKSVTSSDANSLKRRLVSLMVLKAMNRIATSSPDTCFKHCSGIGGIKASPDTCFKHCSGIGGIKASSPDTCFKHCSGIGGIKASTPETCFKHCSGIGG